MFNDDDDDDGDNDDGVPGVGGKLPTEEEETKAPILAAADVLTRDVGSAYRCPLIVT